MASFTLSADASFIIFSTGRTTQKFWPSEHEFDTRVFRPIAPLSFFFSNYSFLSPSPLLNLQTLLGAKQKRALNPLPKNWFEIEGGLKIGGRIN